MLPKWQKPGDYRHLSGRGGGTYLCHTFVMKPRPTPRLAVPLLVAAAVFAPFHLNAANSASAIAAGGLAPGPDTRIVLAKQVVRISDRKIVVDYIVRNDSATDLTTELSFQVPPYSNQWDSMDPAIQAFRSLRLWADDKPVEYQTEATADLGGKDITKMLRSMGIDIASFGHLELGRNAQATGRIWVADYERLSSKDKHRLQSEGVFKGAEGYCLYTVHLRYYWLQSIPAHGTVHVHQEYVPVVGFTPAPPQAEALKVALTQTALQTAANTTAAAANPLGGFCADASFVDSMVRAQKIFAESWGNAVLPHWVDYALTSGRDWHKPIEDFTLIIDIPQPENGQQTLVSFCAPGVVDKKEAGHPQVHLTNFVPGADLHVGFFNAPLEMPTGAVAAAR